MKKRLAITISLVIIVIIVVSAFTAIVIYSASKPFYVGVTYGGDSIEEAKLLIDKVANYTNVFVFTSYALNGERHRNAGDKRLRS